MALDIVIIAAGKGTRMKSALPKVLHRLCGRSLLQHVMDTAAQLGADRTILVCGHGAAAVQASAREVFASTIQASMLGENPPDELDDAEIERSIREINEAIKRSSHKKP